MEFFNIIDWYRTIPTILFFLFFARLFLIFATITIERDTADQYEWNEQVNPEKLKKYFVLLLIAVFFVWFANKSFLDNKTSFDLWSVSLISILGLIAVYIYMEKIIRTPSKSSKNNSFIDINTKPVSVVSFEESTTSFEGVLKTNKSFPFNTEDCNIDIQKDIIEDAKVCNQEEMQLQYQKDIEANDHTDVLQGIQEDNQPQNQQDTEECRSNDTNDGVNEETKFRNFRQRVTKQIHIKGTSVMPVPFPDDIIDQKIESIQKYYGIYCDIEDFKKLLKKDIISNKILFCKKDNRVEQFTKVQYLDFLYFIFGDELLAHTSNTKIICWIKDNFDSENIGNSIIAKEEISALRKKITGIGCN